MSAARRYLARRGERRWSLSAEGAPGGEPGIDLAVVIPALAEATELGATLDSVARNPASERARTLVVCVVNAAEGAPAADLRDNRQTLAMLRAQHPPGGRLRLAWVDASSPGSAMPVRQGVGLARKIGLDLALGVLLDGGATAPALACLDADTRVEPTYLGALRRHFARPDAWAARVDFVHRRDGDSRQRAAIGAYELYLRYHELGLRLAGSPYAFVALGSTIACSAAAYVASGGMNRRQAGEDFYFLQQLVKTGPLSGHGPLAQLAGTTVHPSSRPSRRVPFGTGPKIRELIDGALGERPGRPGWRLQDPRCFALLGQVNKLLLGGECDRATTAAQLLGRASAIAPSLSDFLAVAGLERTLPALQRNAPDRQALAAQLARWFDGLKSLRLLHHLRDSGLVDLDGPVAIADLCQRAGGPAPDPGGDLRWDPEAQRRMLAHLGGLLGRLLCNAASCLPRSLVAY